MHGGGGRLTSRKLSKPDHDGRPQKTDMPRITTSGPKSERNSRNYFWFGGGGRGGARKKRTERRAAAGTEEHDCGNGFSTLVLLCRHYLGWGRNKIWFLKAA